MNNHVESMIWNWNLDCRKQDLLEQTTIVVIVGLTPDKPCRLDWWPPCQSILDRERARTFGSRWEVHGRMGPQHPTSDGLMSIDICRRT